MEIATWVLNILTFAGLVTVIIIYVNQNRILQNKSNIDNFFSLYSILGKRNFGNNVSFFEEEHNFLLNINDKRNVIWNYEGPMCHTCNVICSLYYTNCIDKLMFDNVLKGGIVLMGRWVFETTIQPRESAKKMFPFLYKYWLENKVDFSK